MVDVGAVAGAVVPYVSAAAALYGGAVMQRVAERSADPAVDASVGLGRRILARLSGSARAAQVEEAVTDLATDPEDEDLAAAVRVQVRKALTEDPELAEKLARLLADAGHGGGKFTVTVSGSQGVQVGDGNTQTNTFQARPAAGAP